MEGAHASTRLVKFTKIIHVLFTSNSLFLLMSSPFVFHLLFIPLTNSTLIWYLLSALTIVPALTALFYVIWKYLKTGELNVFHHFFCSYRSNFKLSFLCGAVNLLIGSVFIFNFFYISYQPGYQKLWLVPIVIILVSLVVTGIFQVVILARFNVSFKSLIALSWLYLVKYFQIALRNLAIFFGLMLIAPVLPMSVKISLLVSSFTLIVLLNMKKTLITWESESRAINISK